MPGSDGGTTDEFDGGGGASPGPLVERGERGSVEGEWVVDSVKDHYYCAAGSKHATDHPESCSLIRVRVGWKGCSEKDDTWEPLEAFRLDKNGNNALLRRHFNTLQQQRKKGAQCQLLDTKMTADCGVKLSKRLEAELRGSHGDGDVNHFANCRYGTDSRDVDLGMDRERFKALLLTAPDTFVKCDTTHFEVRCASDVYDWFELCVPPPPRPCHALPCPARAPRLPLALRPRLRLARVQNTRCLVLGFV